MKKEEIYVSVESKEQAETYRKVLEAMGEAICHDYYPFNEKTNRLCYVGGWYLSGEKFTNQKITFGELIDLLTKPKKIAVRVENEKEFNALMKYLNKDNFNWDGIKKNYPDKDVFIYISNKGFDSEKHIVKRNGYQIIPFSNFEKEHNIKLPLIKSEDGVWLYEDSDLFIVWKDNGNWQYDNHHKGFKSSDGEWYVNPEANIEERKLFSTKQSALDWVEAQKHTFPIINETKKEMVTEYEIEFNEKSSVLIAKDNVKFNGSEFDLTQLEVLAIVSKFKSLQ